MSMYNLLHGMNANLGVLVSPFLPMRFDHFPRMRDVFLRDEDHEGDIFVYTRMGAGNAECWKQEEAWAECDNPAYVCDCPACVADRIACFYSYEDDFDCTYKTFSFKVTEHRDDFEKLLSGDVTGMSDWYKNKLREMFADSEKAMEFINKVFPDA